MKRGVSLGPPCLVCAVFAGKQRDDCGSVGRAACSRPGEATANWPWAYSVFLHCHPLTARWIKPLPFNRQLRFEPEHNTVEMYCYCHALTGIF